MRFEWDPRKAASNAAKHGVTFEEATEVFAEGVIAMESDSIENPARELRHLRVGPIKRGVVLVVWTERHADVIRVISARFASRVERALFHEYMRSIP